MTAIARRSPASRRAAAQYRRRLGLRDLAGDGEPGPLIAAGFPDRIAQRRGEPGSFRLSGGGGAKLGLADKLSKEKLLAVAGLEMKLSAQIRLAAPLDAASLAGRSTISVETGLDPTTGSVLARRRRRFGQLILEDRTEPADPAETAAALAKAAPHRLAALDRPRPPAPGPRHADAQPRSHLARPVRRSPRRRPRLARPPPARPVPPRRAPKTRPARHPARHARLGPRRHARPRAAPPISPCPAAAPRSTTPSRCRWPKPRAQHFYGLTETPKLAHGRIELRLALLSPAQRPVAITADLAGFWRGAWAEIRKDMRGRYPRHHWPDDPSTSTAHKPN